MDANRQIAKNTLFLYARKLVTLVLAFYTSRLLLENLGVDDFGLYGLVGSIVVMFNALRGLFSGSIQRFINVEKGRGSPETVNRVFSMGMKIHLWLALLFVVVVEIGGVLMVPNLKLPPGTHTEAMWVLQFSILATVATILTVPYDAVIIANERFNAYAVLSVIDALLRLGIVVLIVVFPQWRVVWYAALVFAVSLVVRLINALYCRSRFGEETRFRNVRDRRLFKEMTVFAGWNFCGNLGYSLTNSGIDLILNSFGGVIANAARAVAYQLRSAISQFTGDISTSFAPQCIRAYSCGDTDRFKSLMRINTKAGFAISAILTFIMCVNAPVILKIWLGNPPAHSVSMVRALMLYNLVRSLHSPVDLLFKASGRLKHYQITEIIIMVLNLPASWLLLRHGLPLYSVFVSMAVIESINYVMIIAVAHRTIGFDSRWFYRSAILPALGCSAILAALYAALTPVVGDSGMLAGMAWCVATGIIALAVSLLTLFSRQERGRLIEAIKRR